MNTAPAASMTEKEKRDRQRTFRPGDWLCSTEDYTRLVDRGFRIMENMDTEQRTAMVRKAVENKDLDLLKSMLKNGLEHHEHFPRENARDDHWWLMFEVIAACKNDQESLDIITYMLDNGYHGAICSEALLFRLVWKNLWRIISALLPHKIDVEDLESTDVQEDVAACLSPEMIEIVEQYGFRYHIDATPAFVMGLVGCCLTDAPRRSRERFRHHQIPMLRSLFAKGMKIPEFDLCGEPVLPIHNLLSFCPERNDDHLCEVVQLFLDKGQQDITAVTEWNSSTMLHIAAEGHKEKVVRLLIERGADVNAVDGSRCTPLLLFAQRACGLQNFELFRHLIESGADVNHSWKKEKEDVPKLLAICMNENITYGWHIEFLLSTHQLQIHERLNGLNFEVFQPSILYKLVQVGLSGIPLLSAVLRHALKTQTRRGYDLVRQVCPNTRVFLEVDDILDSLMHEISSVQHKVSCLSYRVMLDCLTPASLMTWSIYFLRCCLVDTSNNITVLPRIRELSTEIPVCLRPMLTLDCYMVKDEERCLLTPQDDEQELYAKNMEVLQISSKDQPAKILNCNEFC